MNKFLKNMLFLVAAAIIPMSASADDKKTNEEKIDTLIIGGYVVTQPYFKGGTKALYQYISDNFVYPDAAARRSVSGTMEVEFTIEKSGDVSFPSILKGLDQTIDDEILRLIKAMPRWNPATRNGEPVRFKVSMPLNIRASRRSGLKSSTSLQDDYQDR